MTQMPGGPPDYFATNGPWIKMCWIAGGPPTLDAAGDASVDSALDATVSSTLDATIETDFFCTQFRLRIPDPGMVRGPGVGPVLDLPRPFPRP